MLTSHRPLRNADFDERPATSNMKIFVGGLLPPRQQRFRQLFPDVNFTFASDQDSRRRWLSRARGVDMAIIDQARCDHTITNYLRAHDVQYQLVDGNAAIKNS